MKFSLWTNIKYWIYQRYINIHNLVVWFPIILCDQQWDHSYFHKIMRHKLIQMEKFYRGKHAHSSEAYKDADNIKYCIERINRIIDDKYLDNALKIFDETFPDYDHSIHTIPYIDEDGIDTGLEEWINLDTPEQKELHAKCYEQAENDEQNDLDELYAMIRLHIQEWWD